MVVMRFGGFLLGCMSGMGMRSLSFDCVPWVFRIWAALANESSVAAPLQIKRVNFLSHMVGYAYLILFPFIFLFNFF